MGALLTGAALLALAAAIWTEVLKGPQQAPLWRNAPWTIIPGLGLVLLAYGLERFGAVSERSPLGDVALLVLIAGVVLFIWNPPWWGASLVPRTAPRVMSPKLDLNLVLWQTRRWGPRWCRNRRNE